MTELEKVRGAKSDEYDGCSASWIGKFDFLPSHFLIGVSAPCRDESPPQPTLEEFGIPSIREPPKR
jgi:hypothetical protein